MSLFSILIASLLGSPHCAAMCGAFAGIAAHTPKPRYGQLGYHLGRLVTYLSLGVIAGYLGQVLDRFGLMLGIGRIAAVVTGTIMIFSAVLMLSGRSSAVFSAVFPPWLKNLPSRMLKNSSDNSAYAGFLLGLFSTLLPCGWLYTYLALAAATAHIYSAVFVMLVFWVGTLPILLTVGSISHVLSAPLRRHVPVLVAVLMLFAGIFAISGHLTGLESEHLHTVPLCSP